MKTFYIETLGCKVNQYESQALREAWLAAGAVEAPHAGQAETIFINSCAVTQKAVADVRSAIRRLHRAAPAAEIVVSGCAAEAMREELLAIEGVTRVIGQSAKYHLLAPLSKGVGQAAGLPRGPLSGRALAGEALEEESETEGTTSPGDLPPLGAGAFPPFSIAGYNRSRAVLKIQDGCSHCCTYCIVPSTRGKARTRPLADSLGEAKRLLEAGFREIIISGVNLRQYYDKSTQHMNFWSFIAALEHELGEAWQGKARFRISSLEPGQLDAEALNVLKNSRLIAPQLHLSLQSGSPSVLKRMGRGHYSPDGIALFLEQLQEVWPTYGLGADLISGFPGETDVEHRETVALIESLPLTYAHVFPYSIRPNTPAAHMGHQVENRLKKERAAELRAIAARKKKQFLDRALALTSFQVAVLHQLDEEEDSSGNAPKKQEVATAGTRYLQGINDFYQPCLVPGSVAPEGLITVSPVRIEDNKLLVSPWV